MDIWSFYSNRCTAYCVRSYHIMIKSGSVTHTIEEFEFVNGGMGSPEDWGHHSGGATGGW